ncbi:CAP domain-containing protein [Streptomyces sp. NPDC047718]|uniref:CAP domain-containing protein n=1 Tax=Streptomyces sp. NPDC047718 TaxID=3155479 RepID=UPI003406DAE4
MQHHRDDERTEWISTDRSGRAAGHRKPVRKAPLLGMAAAAVVLAGAGAYTLGSPESSPAGTAVASAPSALPPQAGAPGGSAPDPAGAASPTATAAAPGSGASASASAEASPVAGTGGPGETSPKRSTATPPSGEQAAPAPTGRPSGAGPVGPDPSVRGSRSSTQAVRDAEAMSLQLLNAERATVGLPPLAPRQDLGDFARGWAKHMRTSGFGHSSDGDSAYLKTGSRTWIGENIVMWSGASMTAQEAAEKFQSMWRHSPGHYKAQTNPKFTEVGIGIYHDESGWWGVHNFSDGRP